jgi:hypothetical protein
MRVLDEVADAIQIARNRRPQPVLLSVGLEDQFEGLAMMAARWGRVQRQLACPLPLLVFDQGHWWLPDDLLTIWDLCNRVALHHPEWELPKEETSAAWRNAQIFAVVRQALVDAGNLNPSDVVRTALLQKDLHLG